MFFWNQSYNTYQANKFRVIWNPVESQTSFILIALKGTACAGTLYKDIKARFTKVPLKILSFSRFINFKFDFSYKLSCSEKETLIKNHTWQFYQFSKLKTLISNSYLISLSFCTVVNRAISIFATRIP